MLYTSEQPTGLINVQVVLPDFALIPFSISDDFDALNYINSIGYDLIFAA
jgi:hypothetical protein